MANDRPLFALMNANPTYIGCDKTVRNGDLNSANLPTIVADCLSSVDDEWLCSACRLALGRRSGPGAEFADDDLFDSANAG
jgi:hypothetical protein